MLALLYQHLLFMVQKPAPPAITGQRGFPTPIFPDTVRCVRELPARHYLCFPAGYAQHAGLYANSVRIAAGFVRIAAYAHMPCKPSNNFRACSQNSAPKRLTLLGMQSNPQGFRRVVPVACVVYHNKANARRTSVCNYIACCASGLGSNNYDITPPVIGDVSPNCPARYRLRPPSSTASYCNPYICFSSRFFIFCPLLLPSASAFAVGRTRPAVLRARRLHYFAVCIFHPGHPRLPARRLSHLINSTYSPFLLLYSDYMWLYCFIYYHDCFVTGIPCLLLSLLFLPRFTKAI